MEPAELATNASNIYGMTFQICSKTSLEIFDSYEQIFIYKNIHI